MFATKERKGGGEWKARILSSCERFHSPLLNNCSEFSPLGLASACPCSGTPSYGAKREDNPSRIVGIFRIGGQVGGQVSFSPFFFRSLEKKMEKDPLLLFSRRDGIGLFKGSPVNSNFQPFSLEGEGEGLQGRRALWRLSIVLL